MKPIQINYNTTHLVDLKKTKKIRQAWMKEILTWSPIKFSFVLLSSPRQSDIYLKYTKF